MPRVWADGAIADGRRREKGRKRRYRTVTARGQAFPPRTAAVSIDDRRPETVYGPAGGMKVTDTTVHKIDGKPLYDWKEKDGKWQKVPAS